MESNWLVNANNVLFCYYFHGYFRNGGHLLKKLTILKSDEK